jgi:hypothetical protein
MDRNNLKNKMKKITDNQLFVQIYQILKTDSSFKPSTNSSGIYYDMVPLDETTVETINDLITESIQTETTNKLSYTSYYTESEDDKLKKQLIKLNLY